VYRLFKLKRKLKRLVIAYTSYKQAKREEAAEFINQFVSYFVARSAVLEIQKEKKKERMLETIKMRLAVLVIAINWRKLNLSYRGMKVKIGKYRLKLEVINRRKALFNRYTTVSPKNLSSPSQTLNDRSKPGITLLASEIFKTDGELAASQPDMGGKEGTQLVVKRPQNKHEMGLASSRLDSEEARIEALIHHEHREQMKKLKLAHNIPDYSENLPRPLLQERAFMNSLNSIESNALRPSSKVLNVSITASVRAKAADKLLNTGPIVRNTLIQAPPRAHSRLRAGSVNCIPPMSLTMPKDVKVVPSKFRVRSVMRASNEEEPSYMRPTSASKGEKREEKVFKSRRKALGKINIKDLSLPTFSYEMKIKEHSSQEPNLRREPWRPSVPTSSSYTPGLDNSSFIPHKFHRTRPTSSRPTSTTQFLPEFLSLSNEPAPHHPLSISFKNPSAEFYDLIKEGRPMTGELERRAWSTKPSTAGSNKRRR
jgi:hypothetical protein